MLAPFLAASAAAVAPTPAQPIYDLSAPLFGERPGGATGSGQIVYALTVGPGGRVVGCRIIRSDAPRNLAQLSCNVAAETLRFTPARDLDGRPAFGLVRHRMVWERGYVTSPPRPFGVDVALELGKMPAGWESAPVVRVDFLVGADGALSHCGRSKVALRYAQAGGDAKEPPADDRLWRSACAALPKAFPAEIARDRTGRPIASVQSANVLFEVPAAR